MILSSSAGVETNLVMMRAHLMGLLRTFSR